MPKTMRGVQRQPFWAWTVSIAVHLLVLSAFGVVRFSKARGQDANRPAPTARIQSALTRPAPVIPKPKVRKAPQIIARNRYAGTGDKSLPIERIFTPAKPSFQDWLVAGNSETTLLPGSGELSGKIEFFGSGGRQRKVCYLVDCSGSMQGIFTQVRKKLKESITALQPDQYFYVIFFGDGKLYEVGEGKLLRATPKAKSAAKVLIDTMRPAGKTNAVAALERVVRIGDGKGAGPSLVYFLTDGFELTNEDAAAFPDRIANLLQQFAPAMRIDTIAFLPQADDRKMLETIAKQSGGRFICIGGGG